MSAIHDLLAQVSDSGLRERLEQEFDKLENTKKFGLIFEDHLPECTPLYDMPIKVGTKVMFRNSKENENIYMVVKIEGETATCVTRDNPNEPTSFSLDELVRAAEFGDPIYPYLKPVDSVCNAPDSNLWHALIEADNYHALQLLAYLYPGQVDCIYIDPPYNTGAKDWKYNNDFIDSNDQYSHSKWLAFMEKRLRLAKSLLKPETGVMIVAIDDYEYARLSLLIEQIFPEYDISPVIVLHHPQGGSSDNIARTHEYALFVTHHGVKVIKGRKHEDYSESWSLMRGGTDLRNRRAGRPNSFYAIYVDKHSGKVVDVGPHLDADTKYDIFDAPEGCVAVYPIGQDGVERVWRYERSSMKEHIANGDIFCTKNMSLKVRKTKDVKYDAVFSVWTDGRYNAGTNGTNLIYDVFAKDLRFSYPKSLYTVHDCIACATPDNPDALIIDFFAGSGTTMQAVNLLNAEDGGHRRCICVTNNEVSADEQKAFTAKGLHPGDTDWEAHGIAKYVTWPRTKCTIKGVDVNGNPLKGYYIGPDGEKDSGAPMADGFKANAIYFKLGFLDKTAVALGMQFKELLPVLWMKAGAIGRCPSLERDIPDMLIFLENRFAVLINENSFAAFAEQLAGQPEIQTVFIVTDYEVNYQSMVKTLNVKTTYQLYRDYLDNFRINHGRN